MLKYIHKRRITSFTNANEILFKPIFAYFATGQRVCKFADEHSQDGDGRGSPTTVPAIYEKIKRSNSSLGRTSKKLLENSIERVLQVKRQDEDSRSEDDSGSLAEELDGNGVEIRSKTMNDVNQSIVGAWSKQRMPSKEGVVAINRASDQPSVAASKKRHADGAPPAKRRKAVPEIDRSPPTHLSLADLGGVDDIIRQLEDLIVLPLLQPEIYANSKIQPPRGILLHGPPGCGKTMIANAFAAELGVPFIALSAPSVVSGMSGESEKALREHFEEAKKVAPCLLFIDEIDAITPKRESAQREMEKRIVAQLLTCMDGLSFENTGGKCVIVLAATNRPDSLDAALRRGGRFDKEINLGVPSEAVRGQILKALTRQTALANDIDFAHLAKRTPGFVGADLNDLVSTAGAAAIKRFHETLKTESNEMEMDESDDKASFQLIGLRRLIKRAKERPFDATAILITESDFLIALPTIQPSAKREGFATIPDTTWADIGALRNAREELLTAFVDPIKSPKKYEEFGITQPSGVLLCGPPGCGKTLLAQAVANESKANFISVKGPELLNKYVGESERAVRQVFIRARSSVPCLIFFDELDAIVPRRDDTLSESSARVVNTLLTELDGLSTRAGIYVLAATNRPDIIDPAMLRPGRLGTHLWVDLPDAVERVKILQTLTRKISLKCTEAMDEVAQDCEGFSGADLGSLLRQAGYAAIRRNSNSIEHEDFMQAKNKVRPSVTDRRKYDLLKAQWGAPT
ncbi:uncharacterized protein KY384_007037 [Bacidia gigantensis]|uniref:uncharacterized protein n=1 Tax=Bacidia gigantensis TaxID=2732470 RepID=UPI001D038D0D|nr:uncharacterized protein KY384_007037 [Bacidia gigantensis]KAG8528121.1 hypothetical protein KY384_007037 [Bacidia gigantensis]